MLYIHSSHLHQFINPLYISHLPKKVPGMNGLTDLNCLMILISRYLYYCLNSCLAVGKTFQSQKSQQASSLQPRQALGDVKNIHSGLSLASNGNKGGKLQKSGHTEMKKPAFRLQPTQNNSMKPTEQVIKSAIKFSTHTDTQSSSKLMIPSH